MQRTTLASAECFIEWQSADAWHTDRQFFSKLDFWRDILPGELGGRVQDCGPGNPTAIDLAPGQVIPVRDARAIHTVRKQEVSTALAGRELPGLFPCRFYPRGLLAGCNGFRGIFWQDPHPFRVSRVDDDSLTVDLNHPLAGYPLKVGVEIDSFLGTRGERGGQCNDIVVDIAESGPGMQCPSGEAAASLLHAHAFDREDGSDDAGFYRTPRLVQHIDSRARASINHIYRRFIQPDMRVLDLMSSRESHLDGIADSVRVTGLGMNAAELEANPRLSAMQVHDLNRQPVLPYDAESFDVVICSASVEYLVQPLAVFADVARVLRPGGRLIVTFSDRWFSPKVIRLWTELHPFERMGLVLEYFRNSGRFSGLATESWRGRPRPADDKYYPRRLLADPVYAVWGVRCT
jgi:SAM-dependent methyltransferase